MKNQKKYKFFLTSLIGLVLSLQFSVQLFSQNLDTLSFSSPLEDSIQASSTGVPAMANDSISDTLTLSKVGVKISPDAVTDIVEYSAVDSIYFDLDRKEIHMYNESKVHYTDIDLSSAYIGVNLDKSELTATGLPDSTGKVANTPDFKSGETGFLCEEMRYNFKSKKGVVQTIKTSDEQGTLIAKKVKKFADNSANLRNGSYSTCDLDHPHFALKFKKAMQIPDDKIVTGPAYMEIEGLPLPIVLPFGYFPDNKKHKSGIKIPTYGESPTRGFFFQNGGFYWYINDYMDLTLTGDIYTLGSWALRPQFRYKKRYKYTGNIDIGYAVNVIGQEGEPDYGRRPDFSIKWKHSQDAKARPNSRFSANVNIKTSGFNKYNTKSTAEYLNNSFQSSITYSTTIAKRFRITLSGNHSQNTKTKIMTLTLPNFSMSMDQVYPFRRKEPSGKLRWYENIGLTYSLNVQGKFQTYDSLFLTPQMWEDFKNGAQHNIKLNGGSIKVLKYLKWTNSASYTEKWYSKKYKQLWQNNPIYNYSIIDGMMVLDSTIANGDVIQDPISGFYAVREFNASSSLNTTIYGMYSFRKGPVNAIRHVINPSISLSYHPDFTSDYWGYYDSYYDEKNLEILYYLYEGNPFGGKPGGKSGSVSFGLSQNLEMKVRSKKDTITGTKKIKLIENLRLGTSYNMAKDSIRWSLLSVSGNTRLFERLNLTYSGKFDPYAVDTAGAQINTFQWTINKKLLRPENHNWRIGLDYRMDSKMFQSKDKDKKKKHNSSLPTWNISFKYNLTYGQEIIYKGFYWNYDITKEPSITHTIGINGNYSPSPLWKVDFRTNFDLEAEKIAFTEIGIYRDLHCWEMSFKWIPMGTRKSYMFTIKIKSPMLQDVKYEMRDDFRDNGL